MPIIIKLITTEVLQRFQCLLLFSHSPTASCVLLLPWTISFTISTVKVIFKYIASITSFQIASQVSLTMLATVVFPMLKLKAWLCWASPSARYLRVAISFSWGVITSLEWHGFFVVSGPRSPRRCWNLSGDILVNLRNTGEERIRIISNNQSIQSSLSSVVCVMKVSKHLAEVLYRQQQNTCYWNA